MYLQSNLPLASGRLLPASRNPIRFASTDPLPPPDSPSSGYHADSDGSNTLMSDEDSVQSPRTPVFFNEDAGQNPETLLWLMDGWLSDHTDRESSDRSDEESLIDAWDDAWDRPLIPGGNRDWHLTLSDTPYRDDWEAPFPPNVPLHEVNRPALRQQPDAASTTGQSAVSAPAHLQSGTRANRNPESPSRPLRFAGIHKAASTGMRLNFCV